MITTDILKAKKILDNNDVVATETVYGLAGNALSTQALEKIFSLKKRPLFNPLIVHIGSITELHDVAKDVPAKAMQLANAFWPGPLTLVLHKQPHIPDLVTSNKNTVAVRVPAHPITQALLKELNYPLAAPSANPFGSISPTTAAHVYDYFKNELQCILDGNACERGIESTIIGFEENEPVLYRSGTITLSQIEAIVGKIKILDDNNQEIKAPGMLKRHYAPRTKTIVTQNLLAEIEHNRIKKIGVLSFKDNFPNHDFGGYEILSPNADLNEAAKNLYAALHRLDNLNLDLIIAEILPNEGLGKAINDRLQRATQSE